MFADDELYVLNNDTMLAEEVALGPTGYQGQLVLGGPDAAIEIKGSEITPFMHGAQTANPAFTAFLDGYHTAILKAVEPIKNQPEDLVVIAGKWHHVEFNCEPFFAPYLIHTCSADGVVSSQPYDIIIFDTDDLEEGRDLSASMKELGAAQSLRSLREITEGSLWKLESWPTSTGEKRFGGVLWRPTDQTRSAVYTQFSGKVAETIRAELEDELFKAVFDPLKCELLNAAKQNFVTDELHLAVRKFLLVTAEAPDYDRKAAVRLMLAIFARSPFGIRDGHPVLRTKLPLGDVTTLEEVANSTDATGYWFEMRAAGVESELLFERFNDEHRLWEFEPVVLRRQSPDDDDNPYGCLYASEWQCDGEHYASRRLAFGTVPTLSW